MNTEEKLKISIKATQDAMKSLEIASKSLAFAFKVLNKQTVGTVEPVAEQGLLIVENPYVKPPLPTTQSILRGDYDKKGLMKSTRVKKALLLLWREEWQKKKAKMTLLREKAYRSALAHDQTPSDFAQAIIGMRCDPWDLRVKYCDWDNVAKNMTKWIDLYEQLEAGSITRFNVKSLGFPTKKMRGVTVPETYQWDGYDDRLLGDGYRFDPSSETWFKPGDKCYGSLSVYNPL